MPKLVVCFLFYWAEGNRLPVEPFLSSYSSGTLPVSFHPSQSGATPPLNSPENSTILIMTYQNKTQKRPCSSQLSPPPPVSSQRRPVSSSPSLDDEPCDQAAHQAALISLRMWFALLFLPVNEKRTEAVIEAFCPSGGVRQRGGVRRAHLLPRGGCNQRPPLPPEAAAKWEELTGGVRCPISFPRRLMARRRTSVSSSPS